MFGWGRCQKKYKNRYRYPVILAENAIFDNLKKNHLINSKKAFLAEPASPGLEKLSANGQFVIEFFLSRDICLVPVDAADEGVVGKHLPPLLRASLLQRE